MAYYLLFLDSTLLLVLVTILTLIRLPTRIVSDLLENLLIVFLTFH